MLCPLGQCHHILLNLQLMNKMKILVTNDDGYSAKGIRTLVDVLSGFGDILVVAPKNAQSGMSMAVSMGYKPLAVKHMYDVPGQSWWYLDGTPASCVKYAIDNVMYPELPDLVVSGINHGSNASTAAVYSGTIGAAMEGAVNGIPSIGVSLDKFDPDADFSAVREHLPGILRKLISTLPWKFGSFVNVNFPKPPKEIKGIKVCPMGMGHWEKEYRDYAGFMAEKGLVPSASDKAYLDSLEPGESVVVMAGDFVSNPGNPVDADHLMLDQGWITITPQNIDNTDHSEIRRLCDTI